MKLLQIFCLLEKIDLQKQSDFTLTNLEKILLTVYAVRGLSIDYVVLGGGSPRDNLYIDFT